MDLLHRLLLPQGRLSATVTEALTAATIH